MRHPNGHRQAVPAPGFTLLELMVVLVLLGMAVAVTAPATGRFLDRLERRKQERRVMAAVRYARLQAVTSGRPVILRPGEDGRVLVFTGGVDERREIGLADGQRLLFDPDTVVFYPEGMATPATITLAGDRRSRTIVVDLLTGLPGLRIQEDGR